MRYRQAGSAQSATKMTHAVLRKTKLCCMMCGRQLLLYAVRGRHPITHLRPAWIIENYTKGDGKCHGCGELFARPFMNKTEICWRFVNGKAFTERPFSEEWHA
ncbi:C2H2-type domain-containing protein [Plasmodiophora brassicae]|uniref:Uncharacterized protein n=1 Tax=Plasmodiophora brassicae TaxID=37360 RepID=A0A0G4IVV3_PLABS|nr:hypothetical protein PBRA_001278 [Plasmodiophora brassicae]